MKRTAFTILTICLTTMLWAQIPESETWYDGTIVYAAASKAQGRVLMTAMDEGQEMEFMLVPTSPGARTYHVQDGPDGGTNDYRDCSLVRYRHEGDLHALCFYKGKTLYRVMSMEADCDAERISKQRWLSQLAGQYHANDVDCEYNLTIYGTLDQNGKAKAVFDGKTVSLDITTFNGRILGCVSVSEGSLLDYFENKSGQWDLIPELDDLGFFAVSEADMQTLGPQYARHHNGADLNYRHVLKGKRGRFAYASTVLLNDRQFIGFSKTTLRIMRNEILARHGYIFSTPEMSRYFSDQPWYRPAASNNGIAEKLSLVERLNIELIKAEEDNPDHEKYQTEQ